MEKKLTSTKRYAENSWTGESHENIMLFRLLMCVSYLYRMQKLSPRIGFGVRSSSTNAIRTMISLCTPTVVGTLAIARKVIPTRESTRHHCFPFAAKAHHCFSNVIWTRRIMDVMIVIVVIWSWNRCWMWNWPRHWNSGNIVHAKNATSIAVTTIVAIAIAIVIG